MTRRQAALLYQIIEKHIDVAEPISSKLLAESGFWGLSPASIRSEMNSLEQEGYLEQLHTSGGRVPTAKAYRFFVDTLAQAGAYQADSRSQRAIQEAVQQADGDPVLINKLLAKALARLSDNLVVTVIDNAREVYKTGLSSLFEYPEFRQLDHVFRLTEFFEDFEDMFSRIERQFRKQHEPIQVFIGKESPIDQIEKESLIVGTYNLPRGYAGSVALIGPMRMDYAKNIGLIDYARRYINHLTELI